MTSDVGPLLERMRHGDESALNSLVAALYDELQRLASRQLRRGRPAHTLQTAGLVHEAYLKLAGACRQEFADRAHFLAVASRVMRQVLVDYARARTTRKRGGDCGQVTLTTGLQPGEDGLDQVELLHLDAALTALAREDAALAQLIELRFFAGMTAEESAEALGQSVHVVRHDLRLAQAWLRRRMSS